MPLLLSPFLLMYNQHEAASRCRRQNGNRDKNGKHRAPPGHVGDYAQPVRAYRASNIAPGVQSARQPAGIVSDVVPKRRKARYDIILGVHQQGDQTDYEMDLLERFEHGEFYSADSIHYQDTTKYYTAGGRVVYGGGGILPDIFVGRDTTLYTPFYNKCVNLAYTYQFAFQYTDKHRKELKKYKDYESLERHLLRQNVLGEFLRFADKKGINAQDSTLYLFSDLTFDEQVKKSTPLLNRLICAYIVRDVLDENAFYAIFERDDEIILRALEELEKK